MKPTTQNNISRIHPNTISLVRRRISNRRYPSQQCKKKDCQMSFTPTDKRQKYCCEQHRIDHNNDLRNLKAQPGIELDKKIQHNQTVLKKIFQALDTFKRTTVGIDLLIYEKYDFAYYTEKQINTGTNMAVYWNYFYGLEGRDAQKTTFIIHRREKLK
jgi:hypothetical protein